MGELVISEKYEKLFQIPFAKLVMDGKSNEISNVLAEELSKIDIIIITGGRNSGKSFDIALADAYWAEEHNYRTLFTRYTLTSAEDTIIPDFMEKVDILGYRNNFKIRKDRITSRVNKSKVVFKGIKTSGGNQTANLKSLKDFNVFILDEAEEMDSYDDWRKIYLSMRANDVQNLSIIAMNPSNKEFWVFKKFFELRGVQPGFNGQVGNVLYIHTTYLDLEPEYVPRNVRVEFERMKIEEPDDYANVVMGEWLDDVKGSVFKKDQVNYFNLSEFNYDNVIMKIAFIDVADEGTDSLSMPIGLISGDFIYIVDWYFSKDNTDITIPGCAEYTRLYGLDYLAIETNGVGAVFSKELHKQVISSTTVMFINQTGNKHMRIIANAGGIKRRMVFRKDIPFGSSYEIAMREFFKYNKDRSLNDHDDAADSLTGMNLLFNDLLGI